MRIRLESTQLTLETALEVKSIPGFVSFLEDSDDEEETQTSSEDSEEPSADMCHWRWICLYTFEGLNVEPTVMRRSCLWSCSSSVDDILWPDFCWYILVTSRCIESNAVGRLFRRFGTQWWPYTTVTPGGLDGWGRGIRRRRRRGRTLRRVSFSGNSCEQLELHNHIIQSYECLYVKSYICVWLYVCVCACDFTSSKVLHIYTIYVHIDINSNLSPINYAAFEQLTSTFHELAAQKKQPTPPTGEPSEARTMCKSCRPRRVPKAFGRSCMGGPWHTTNPTKNLMIWEWLPFLKGTMRCFLDFLGSNRLFQASGEFQRFVGKLRQHFGQSNLISFVSVRIFPWLHTKWDMAVPPGKPKNDRLPDLQD